MKDIQGKSTLDRVSKVQVIGNQSETLSAKTSLIFGYSLNYSTGGLQTLRPPQGTRINFFSLLPAKLVIRTQQQTENAKKWLHTINLNQIEPFWKLLFVLSHENINWWRNDGLHCKSELHDGTYSLLSQTGESQNTIKMLMLSVF